MPRCSSHRPPNPPRPPHGRRPLRALCATGGALLALGLGGAAGAQQELPETRPPIPRELPPPEAAPPDRLLPVIPVPEDDRQETLLAEGRIDVTGFRFEGNQAIPDAELAEVTAAYVGRERSYSDLLEARDRVTRKYIDEGYISSGARLPRQDFAGGVVRLEIVEGELSSVEIETDGRLRESWVRPRVSGRGALNIRDVQRRLALLQDDPRVERVTAELVPTERAGSSLLSLELEEGLPWFASGAFDNATPPSVGGLHGSFSAGHRNVTGFGDTLWASYGVAEGLHDVAGSYLLPVPGRQTQLELAGRGVWSEVVDDEDFQDLGIESELQSYRGTLHQPLLRELSRGLALFGGFEWKRGDTTLSGLALGLESTVTALRAGVEYWERRGPRGWSARGTMTGGLPALEASDEFASWLLQLQYVEDLPRGWLTPGSRVEARFDGQIASEDLPGIEQLAIGGRGTVRGYRENRLVRDAGLATSVELRVPLPLPELGPLRTVELGVFSDVGYGANLGDSSDAEDLYSVGLGLHAFAWDYVEAHIEWARALREVSFPTEGEDDIQDEGLHFALVVHFP